ncbi:MAG: hypothetical protein HQM16_02810 [Deltaproteobacteria bacterium]|nr:hypothetical protein [Deltaproteobacteria bacterium]
MDVNKDFKEFLELLNRHNCKYVIVGGYAVIFHGYPRFTGDIDIYYQLGEQNTKSLLTALKEFGFDFLELTPEELNKKGQIFQLGNPPNRIDLINQADGIEFDQVWENKVEGKYGNLPVYFISLDDLMKNKRAADRNKDRGDVEHLKN